MSEYSVLFPIQRFKHHKLVLLPLWNKKTQSYLIILRIYNYCFIEIKKK